MVGWADWAYSVRSLKFGLEIGLDILLRAQVRLSLYKRGDLSIQREAKIIRRDPHVPQALSLGTTVAGMPDLKCPVQQVIPPFSIPTFCTAP